MDEDQKEQGEIAEAIINEFCMTICTVNGSGSGTANNLLYRALFRMGIPTWGKTFFLRTSRGSQPGLSSVHPPRVTWAGCHMMTSSWR